MFPVWIIVDEGVDLVAQGRIIRVIESDQPLVLRVFRLRTARVLLHDLAIDLLRFLVMAELTLAIPGDQHHLGSHFFRDLVLALLVIGDRLCVLASLILEPEQTDRGDSTPASGFRHVASLLQKRGRLRDHCLIRISLFVLREIECDKSGPNRRVGLQRRLARLGSERFKLFQRIGFSPGGKKNGADREPRIVAKWIGIFDCDDLLIDIARLILFDRDFRGSALQNNGRRARVRMISLWLPRGEKAGAQTSNLCR